MAEICEVDSAHADDESEYDTCRPDSPIAEEQRDERFERIESYRRRVFDRHDMDPYEAYEHTWLQLIRLSQRCNYWYTSQDALDADSGKHDIHEELVREDLARLFQAIHHGFPKQRMQFARILGNEVLSKIEGPRGLGTTSKGEFQRAVRHSLFVLGIRAQWGEMKLLDDLDPSEDDESPGEWQPMSGRYGWS